MSGRTTGAVNTPGWLGYAAAIGISVVSYGALLGLWGGGLGGALAAAVFVPVFGWPYAVPIGVVGAAVVHLTCRGVPEQWVHVAAAAGCGVVGGALFWGWFGHTAAFGMGSLMVGVAAGLGRTAVVPLVERRRAAVERDFPAHA